MFCRFSLSSGEGSPYFFRALPLERVRFGARVVEAALAAALALFALFAPGLRPGLPGFALVAAGAAAAGAAAAALALPLPRAGAAGLAGLVALGVFAAAFGRADMGLRREDVVPARTP